MLARATNLTIHNLRHGLPSSRYLDGRVKYDVSKRTESTLQA